MSLYSPKTNLRITAQSGNYSAVANDLVVMTTSGTGVTVTLPLNPADNDRIGISYRSQTAGDFVDIERNSRRIDGILANMTLYVADNTLGLHDYVVLQYDLTNTNWIVVEDGRIAHVAGMSRAAAQSINNATATKILFDTEIYDIGGIADPTTNDRFNVLRAGRYQATASWLADGVDSGELATVQIWKNGVAALEIYAYSAVANGFPCAGAAMTLSLASGDYLEMAVYHSEGAAINTRTEATFRPQMYVAEQR